VVGVAGVLALAILGVVVAALMQPETYRVERSRVVDAPPELVHAWIDDFSKWPEWSPWEERDPHIRRNFSNPPSGRGASYRWNGNDDVGQGEMTITQSSPSRIDIRLEFIEPFASVAMIHFALAPSGVGTRVTWSMEGTNNFVGKVFAVFMDMDALIGADFEKGLAKLGRVARAR